MTSPRIDCAGCIAFDPDGRLLLIRRAHAPAAGSWSVPGGKCRPGEAPEQACVREAAEETGLEVAVLRFAGQVERAGPGGVIFDIYDYVCAVTGGRLRAGDDATDVRWASRADLAALDVVAGLVDVLTEWGELPS